MDKAITDFLAAPTVDADDLIAARAVKALYGCAALATIAYGKDDFIALSQCHTAALSAAYLFAAVNADKDYDFAGKVYFRISRMTAQMQKVKREDRLIDSLLEQCESIRDRFLKLLAPDATVDELAAMTVSPRFWSEQGRIPA